MFEREMRDASFVKRWSIVRTLRDQSVAEHSFFVAAYTNDLCIRLNLSQPVHLAALQYAIWHDMRDEIFTGDLPGPNKRALLSAEGARDRWDEQLDQWSYSVFPEFDKRTGGTKYSQNPALSVIKLVVKIADWMDAAMHMATEYQMGNKNANRHVSFDSGMAIEAVDNLCDHLGLPKSSDEIPFRDEPRNIRDDLKSEIELAIEDCLNGKSKGPRVSGEKTSTSATTLGIVK